MKKTTVYEDEAKKEEARRKKREARLEKHLVVCPHCGEKTLDHLTKCHRCGGALTPRGYVPMSEKKEKLFKGIGWGIGIAAVVVFIVLVIYFN